MRSAKLPGPTKAGRGIRRIGTKSPVALGRRGRPAVARPWNWREGGRLGIEKPPFAEKSPGKNTNISGSDRFPSRSKRENTKIFFSSNGRKEWRKMDEILLKLL